MKKAIAIIVFGLLWCGVAIADGSNLKKTLLNSNLVLKFNGDSIHTIKFKADGTATWHQRTSREVQAQRAESLAE